MKRLTKNTGESWQPAVAVFGNNIHVVWSDDTPGNYDIYYKRSMDNGLTWSKQKRLTRNAGGSRQPAIALSGRNIHVVWWDETPGNDEVYYKCSTNNGATWGKQKRLTNSAESSTDATIAVSGGSIHVAWGEDNIIEGSEIYYRRSTDNGATWRKAKRLTNNGKTSIDPDIAVSGGNIHVTWSDYSPGNADIFYKGSKDNGATWGKRIRLTKNAGESATPAVAVLSKTVYVVWDDDTPGNVELYYKWSADGGAIWRKQTRLTRNAGGSRAPDVALWGGNIHIVWSDSTLGNTDIYYKRGP
jgi:hypothetical protein